MPSSAQPRGARRDQRPCDSSHQESAHPMFGARALSRPNAPGSPRGSPLLARVAALRQRRLLLAALQGVQVVHVLVEDPQRVVARMRPPWPARSSPPPPPAAPAARAWRGSRRGRPPPSGSRRSTGSRRRHRTPHQRAITAMPSRVWPSAGCSSSSSEPSSTLPGTGSAWTWPSASGCGRSTYSSASLSRSSRWVAPGSSRSRSTLGSPSPSASPGRRAGRAGGRSRRAWRSARRARSRRRRAGRAAPRARPGSRASRSASPRRRRAERRRSSATSGW